MRVMLCIVWAVSIVMGAWLTGCPAPKVPPAAAFSASPLEGEPPLLVQFTDASAAGSAAITAWNWDFGDGTSSTLQHPAHTYTVPGTYTVSLQVTSPAGTDTETMSNYVRVTDVGPGAAFFAVPLSGVAPLAVQFTDSSAAGSAAITAWSWDFGDGATSTLQHPPHTYTVPGTYTVTLQVTTAVGSDIQIVTDYVTVSGTGPTAAFSATPASGDVPLPVQFTDLSVAGTSSITAWHWDFGDGATSTMQHPLHLYTVPGAYTVTLQITTAVGADTLMQPAAVNALATGPTAAFSAAPASGIAPLAVQFTDTSAGGTFPITLWHWDFGDGATSTLQHPEHTYSSLGAYTVSLEVTTDAGSDTETIPACITITAVRPEADFTATPLLGIAPSTVQFTDTSETGSSPITTWHWDFGDGATSTLQHPEHIYTEAGVYTVSLTVSNDAGADVKTKTDFVFVVALPGEEEPPFATTVLFDNHNTGAASGNPASVTTITLDEPAYIALLFTWHLPESKAVLAGHVSLQAEDGTVFGPWAARAEPSDIPGAVLWRARPNSPLDAGRYAVIVSHPDSWLQNAGSGGAGFALAEGVPYVTTGAAVLDAAGGLLEAEGLRITAPAGAFTEPATLSVSQASAYEEDAVTAQYILRGLPPEHGPLTLELPLLEKTFEYDSVQVIVGASGYQESMRKTVLDRTPLPATIENGKVRFALAATASAEKKPAKQEAPSTWTYVYSWGRIEEGYLNTAHFRLQPANNIAQNKEFLSLLKPRIELLGAYLENAYDILTGTGEGRLGLAFPGRTPGPIVVNVAWWLWDPNHGYAIRSRWGRNSDYLDFNMYSVVDTKNETMLRAAAIHELFHIIQYNYAPTTERAGDQGWMYDACSTWSEWLVTDNSHYPELLEGNEGRLPLNGLLDATNSETLNNSQQRSADYHGYVASLFIRYLAEAHGNNTGMIGNIWKLIGNNNSLRIAFDSATNEHWTGDWQNFCRDLYGGALLLWRPAGFQAPMQAKEMSRLVEVCRPGTVVTVNTEDDAIGWHVAAGPLPPVSTTLFQAKINAIPSRDGFASIQIVPHQLTPQTRVQVRWYVPKPAAYADWTSTVLGEVAPNTPLTVNAGWLNVPFVLQLVTTNTDPAAACPEAGVRWTFGPLPAPEALHHCTTVSVTMVGEVNGSIENSVVQKQGAIAWDGWRFTGSWSSTGEGSQADWSVSGEMDPGLDKVKNLHAIWKSHVVNDAIIKDIEYDIIFENMPFSSIEPRYQQHAYYTVAGEGARPYVKQARYTYRYEWTEAGHDPVTGGTSWDVGDMAPLMQALVEFYSLQ